MTAISPIPELRLLAISSPNDWRRPSGGSGFVICILDTRKRASLIPRRYRFGYAVRGYVFGAIKKITDDCFVLRSCHGIPFFSARSFDSVNRVVGQADSP